MCIVDVCLPDCCLQRCRHRKSSLSFFPNAADGRGCRWSSRSWSILSSSLLFLLLLLLLSFCLVAAQCIFWWCMSFALSFFNSKQHQNTRVQSESVAVVIHKKKTKQNWLNAINNQFYFIFISVPKWNLFINKNCDNTHTLPEEFDKSEK